MGCRVASYGQVLLVYYRKYPVILQCLTVRTHKTAIAGTGTLPVGVKPTAGGRTKVANCH